MVSIHKFTFNAFEENTYILWDETKECAIIDPGCQSPDEQNEMSSFIAGRDLKPVRLLNTHCHLDHIFGNRFIADRYGIDLAIHRDDHIILMSAGEVSLFYGFDYDPSPEPAHFLDESDCVTFGASTLDILHAPGHAPGHIVFVDRRQKFVIGGDVLFQGGIGRTDLPGGNYEQLIASIRSKLFTLPDDFQVHPGHGPSTNIAFEKTNNPFLQ